MPNLHHHRIPVALGLRIGAEGGGGLVVVFVSTLLMFLTFKEPK